MNLTPRDTFFDLDKFFDGFYQPSAAGKKSNSVFNPHVDIHETDDSYELIAELPGISKDNISVAVDDSTLTIEASNEQETTEEKNGRVLRRERRSGKFIRSFNLGQNIDQSAIKANFKDGLLILTIPKIKEEVIKTRKIDIH